MSNPIPNIVLHPLFVGNTDSADFQGPIAEWWHHPNSGRLLTTRRYCRFCRASGPDRQTVSDDFRHFSLKSPPNMMLTPFQQWHLAGDSPYARSTRFYHLFYDCSLCRFVGWVIWALCSVVYTPVALSGISHWVARFLRHSRTRMAERIILAKNEKLKNGLRWKIVYTVGRGFWGRCCLALPASPG